MQPDTKDLNASLSAFGERTAAMLHKPDFYLEIILIGVCVFMALLVDSLVRHALLRRTAFQHQHRILYAAVRFMVSLMAPLMTILLLGIAKPICASLTGSAVIIVAAGKLATAWLFARAVLHMVESRFVAWLMGSAILIVAALSVAGLLSGTAEFLDSLSFEFGKIRLSALIALKGVMLLVFLTWLVGAVSQTLERTLLRQPSLSLSSRELIVKLTRIVLYFTAFLVTMNAVGIDLTALAVFGGALGVGIGFGLQKITANFISGIILLFERSVRIGDFIEVGGDSGWVRQMAVRYTLLELSDGREALLPNEQLMTNRVVNWTYRDRRSRIDIPIPIAYGADAGMVRAILLDAAASHPKVMKDPEPKCFLREFRDSGMQFLLTVWLEDLTAGRLKTQSQIMFTILEKFSASGVELSAPPREVFVHAGPLSQ